MPSIFARVAGRSILVLILSGMAGAILVYLAPGLESDERFLDPRLSTATLETLRQERASGNPVRFYAKFLSDIAQGNGGRSIVFGQPVATLIRQRVPVTLRTIAWGLTLAWSCGLLAAIAAVLGRSRMVAAAGLVAGTSLLCIPSAVLATICLVLRLPPAAAITAVVFPQVFAHASQQIRAAIAKPHHLMARARGVSPVRVFAFHVIPAILRPMAALTGVSASIAVGAAIPVEALADSPGLGQLAWRAALGRDLQLLVVITLLFTAVTVLANALADLVTVHRLGRAR